MHLSALVQFFQSGRKAHAAVIDAAGSKLMTTTEIYQLAWLLLSFLWQ